MPNNLNCYTSYSNLNNDYDKIYKVPVMRKSDINHILSSRNEDKKKLSSKIKLKNNIFLNSFNINCRRSIKDSPKRLNLSNNSTKLSKIKVSFNERKKKNPKIIKTKKNNSIWRNYPHVNNKKKNSIFVIAKNYKLNKSKIKDNFETGINRYINNTKIIINNKTKNFINKNIFFPKSFLNYTKSKVITIRKKIL